VSVIGITKQDAVAGAQAGFHSNYWSASRRALLTAYE